MAMVINIVGEDSRGDFQSRLGGRQRPFTVGVHGMDSVEP